MLVTDGLQMTLDEANDKLLAQQRRYEQAKEEWEETRGNLETAILDGISKLEEERKSQEALLSNQRAALLEQSQQHFSESTRNVQTAARARRDGALLERRRGEIAARKAEALRRARLDMEDKLDKLRVESYRALGEEFAKHRDEVRELHWQLDAAQRGGCRCCCSRRCQGKHSQ